MKGYQQSLYELLLCQISDRIMSKKEMIKYIDNQSRYTLDTKFVMGIVNKAYDFQQTLK
jgi:hypothetical protein